jgi:TonB family protein
MEGSDKREPFAESTQTVLVFPQGAVIRLASSLAPGQLVFLTHEKTKKEVVCQVVKSKNYRTVTGYVELEFTEPAAGFWGMRFPTTAAAPSAGAPAAPRPVTAPPAAAPKIAAPTVPSTVPPIVPPTQNVVPAKPLVPPAPAIKPAAQTSLATSKSAASSHVQPESTVLPTAPKVLPSAIAPPATEPKIDDKSQLSPARTTATVPASFSSVIPDISELFGSSASFPAVPKTETPAQASAPSTEELRLQAAKLQEQLSAMLFSRSPKPQTAGPDAPPAAEAKPAAVETVGKVLELADLAPKPATNPAPSVHTSKITPIVQKPITSTFGAEEEMKIPAWLAPLANNSETRSSVSTAVQESPAYTEPASSEKQQETTSGFTAAEDSSQSIQATMFGGQLSSDPSLFVESKPPAKSKKGLLIGVAACLLIAGGVFWYSKQPGNVLTGAAAVSPASSPSANTAPNVPSEAATKPQSSIPPNVASNSTNASFPSIAPAKQTTLPEPSAPISVNAPTSAASKQPSEKALSIAAIPEPKKPVVGVVQLAKPVMNRGAAASENGEGTPSIDVNQTSNGEGLVSLAAGRAKGPAAPLAVGGDVKQAQLIKSVPPIYPLMAKSQHVAGDVKIDALIDESGNVSSMKVLSGPTLLHQAALAAVKQWHYHPAELDGKPTPMHLTVMVQFRLQ